MQNTFVYLKTCDTCRKILNEIKLPQPFHLREIKSNPLTADEIQQLGKLSGSFVSLINKRAQKFKQPPYAALALNEATAKELLAADYTFLKRPILLAKGKLIAGNSKADIEAMKELLHG